MIRLLVLEQDAAFADLALRTLRSSGLKFVGDRVADEREFTQALSRNPDLILGCSDAAKFDSFAALAIAQSKDPRAPFIFLSEQRDAAAKVRALGLGATGYILRSELAELEPAIRAALESATAGNRRAGDETAPPVDLSDTATLLLERQDILDQTLRPRDSSRLSDILSRTPPSPVALILIQSEFVRERYVKILYNAEIATEIAADVPGALSSLAEQINAVLFTDQLELVRVARQLEAGSATHMVLVESSPENKSDGLRAGANEVMPSDARGDEFWAHMTVVRRIISFAETLQTAITGNRILSTIDELTRCGNRRFFEQQFPREVARAVRLRRPLSLVMCDVDHFKRVNDQHGHQVGDEVLREFGDRLTRGLRLGQDWAARVGGEEFAVVLPETGGSQAVAIAERLREIIGASAFMTASGPISVTASFGVCGVRDAAPGRDDLNTQMVVAADSSLFESKRQGRNRVTDGSTQLYPIGITAPGR